MDSRNVCPGDLFFALPGDKTDGHAFIGQAAKKGAVGAVVRKDCVGLDQGLPLIRCDDVLKALQDLAKTYLKQNAPKVVAVTGSLGKTTTKDFIAHLLKIKYRVSVSPGNSNSQIGLPLAILNHTTAEDEILILEMGMTHPGQILKLVDIAPPTVAVVTNVALVHACNFSSLAEIERTKAEIFSHPKTKMGFYHSDSNMEGSLLSKGKCPKLSFSTTEDAADWFLRWNAESIEVTERLSKNDRVTTPLHPIKVPGEHNKQNFLAALAVARYLGLDWKEINQGINTLSLPERRLEHVEKCGALFINDAYNASEMSVKAALNSMPIPKAGAKRIAVLGEMLELGKFSAQCHRAVGEHSLKCVDLMLCFGEECRHISECWQAAERPVVWAKERAEIVAALKSKLCPGDVVLLKGSRSKGVWKVLEELS